MLKAVVWTPIALFGLMLFETACLKGVPIEEGPKECKAPAETYQGTHINQCLNNNVYFCCAYAFMMFENTKQEQLCFHVVCQPADDCSADWLFYGTRCPPEEEESRGKDATYRKKEQSAEVDRNSCLPDSDS